MFARSSFHVSQKRLTTAIIAAAIAVFFLMAATTGVLGAPKAKNIESTGNIVFFSDASCKTRCTSVSWGNINPGSTSITVIYIKNLSTAKVTLTMSATNWSPQEATSFLSLSWNRNNYVLQPGKTVQATLTLTASAEMGNLTDFSFTIVLSATELG